MIKEIIKSGRGKLALCVCDVCGKEFKRPYGNYYHRNGDKRNKSPKTYCDNKCRVKDRIKKTRTTCSHCGKKMWVIPYKIKINQYHFCSRKCFNQWNRGINHIAYRGGGKEVICAYCGKKFLIDRCRHKSYKNHFCNVECKYNWVRKNMPKGSDSPSWRGGRTKCPNGYIKVRDYSGRYVRNCIYEHRLVMEKHLGRYLYPWETVHHKNGIKDDNRIENLKLLPGKEHNTKVQKIYLENQRLKERLALLESATA